MFLGMKNLAVTVCTSVLLHTVLQAVQQLLGLCCRVLIFCIWISVLYSLFLVMGIEMEL